ncbi:MAG TPA: hypothetical protein VK465_02430 [Fibrobacteria bacterium]|nr:hypothetical protein [Fibrobacteria bacterium]
MKRLLLLIAAGAGSAFGQQSGALKKLGNYLPSLTEIGFITGSINTYLQAAALVRTVNREIALAKSLGDRMDALEQQAKDMYGQFQDLRNINPYDMDSWANWLQRADNLNGYEMGQFTFILGNQILRTIDQKMTVDFYGNIQQALSYEVKDGNFKAVLNRYFMRSHYVNYEERVRQVAVNNARVAIVANQHQLMALTQALAQERDPARARGIRTAMALLELRLHVLEGELRSPTVDLSSTDRQIAFVSDVAQGLAHDFEMLQGMLATHQKNLVGLNKAWRETAEGRLAKEKRTDGVLSPIQVSRPVYDPSDADKAPAPTMNPDKPTEANVSHGGSPTNMGDILFLQNKIDFERLAMAQTALLMDLLAANAKATMLAAESGKRIARMNTRSQATFGAENLSHALTRSR